MEYIRCFPFDLADATFLVDGFTSGLSSTDLLVLRIRQLERPKEDIATSSKDLEECRFRSKKEFEWKYRKRMKRDHYKTRRSCCIAKFRRRDEDESKD